MIVTFKTYFYQVEDYNFYRRIYGMTQNELRENLSLNIKLHRKQLGFTQEKLAEKAELSSQTINDIEGCRTWVSDKSLIKIADALHTTPANLLLTHSCNSSESFDILRFKTQLQDSVRQKIEEIFTENMSNLK